MKRFIFIFLFTIVGVTMSGQTATVLSVAGQKILLDLNSKQNVITLTTSGNAGVATFTGATLNIPNYTLAGLGGQTAFSGTGLVYSTAGTISYITDNSINWNTAYTDRNKWDGGATGLVAATGRTSLGASTVGTNMFMLTNPSAITFPRFNADNTVTALDAAAFRTAIGAAAGITSVTAATLRTTGTDLSLSVATGTTTPVITLNVPTASATNRGALTSTDWSTFNNKQAALSGTGLVKSAAGVISYITDNSANWNTAYTDRNKWDGGATGLVAATGRTSLGASTVGANMFTLTNPSAITFPRFNADNTVSALDAVSFRAAIGAGTGNGTVTQVNALTLTNSAGADLTSTVATNTTIPTITLNVPNASATQRGALTSADWTTFNGKQNALTNPVTMSTVGTVNYMPKFTAGTTIANSQIFDNGTNVGIGTATPGYKLEVSGSVRATSFSTPTGTNTQYLMADGSLGTAWTLTGNTGTTPGTNFIGTTDAKALVFKTAGAQRLYADELGNFLVGSSTNAIDQSTSFEIRKGDGTGTFSNILALTSDEAANGKSKLTFSRIGANGNRPAGFEIDSYDETSIGLHISLAPSGGTVAVNVPVLSIDSSYKFLVSGKAGGTQAWKQTSDKRLKTNIQPVENGLNKLMQMKPITYDKKASLESNDYDIPEIGFIAQELKILFPKGVVDEGADKDKLLSVNYTALIPVLTKAIQEQQKIIETEKVKNDKQQKEIDELKAMVKQLMEKK